MKNRGKEKVLRFMGVGAFAVFMFATLTACGKKTINVTETLSVKFDGCNGYGVAELENEYAWESEAFKEAGVEQMDALNALANGVVIESAVSYEVSPKENLSNGDEVTVRAVYSNEAVEDYNIKFTASEKKFVVEGLPDVRQVDLFENIDVAYKGIAPNVTASIVDGNTDSYVLTTYALDKSSNLNVGDVVTVTAKYDKQKLLEAGYMAESDTKEFQVSGVAKYVNSFEEINQETWDYLKKECSDLLEARFSTSDNYYSLFYRATGNDGNSILNNNYLEAYNALRWGTGGEKLIFEKPQYELKYVYLYEVKNYGTWSLNKNDLTLVYIVHVNDNVAGEVDAYIPISFKNILLNDDGSVYVDIATREISNSGFDFNTVYNSIVNANKADWNIVEKEITE